MVSCELSVVVGKTAGETVTAIQIVTFIPDFTRIDLLAFGNASDGDPGWSVNKDLTFL